MIHDAVVVCSLNLDTLINSRFPTYSWFNKKNTQTIPLYENNLIKVVFPTVDIIQKFTAVYQQLYIPLSSTNARQKVKKS